MLFGIPLVASAALLSFAHGANDVANAVGPLAAIVQTVTTGNFNGDVVIPLWVMLIGAFGISFGLSLFGPKLIRMVGSQITKLKPMRAYCVSLSAALKGLAHELRNPLAPIANAASVLRTLESSNPILVRLREILERQVIDVAPTGPQDSLIQLTLDGVPD